MIEHSYNPKFVPMDLDDFEDDFEEIEDDEDYKEFYTWHWLHHPLFFRFLFKEYYD